MQPMFQIGDEVRGKDSLIKGKVLKILDAGYLMILESEFEMEMNIHESEVIKAEPIQFTTNKVVKDSVKPKKTGSTRLDLHFEKLPQNYRNEGVLFGQLSFCDYHLAKAIQSGITSMEIIHGKGSGKLHQEILKRIKSNPGVKSYKIQKAALELPHAILVYFR